MGNRAQELAVIRPIEKIKGRIGVTIYQLDTRLDNGKKVVYA
jgi:hypothetical protein